MVLNRKMSAEVNFVILIIKCVDGLISCECIGVQPSQEGVGYDKILIHLWRACRVIHKSLMFHKFCTGSHVQSSVPLHTLYKIDGRICKNCN